MKAHDKEFPVNYTKEAFKHPVNLGALLLATIFGFVIGNFGLPTALVLSMVCATELMYLGIVPRLPRFRKIIKLKKLSENNSDSSDQELFKNLDEKSKRKYLVLRQLVKSTKHNFEKLPYSSQGLLENIRKKMEDLLSKYLLLLDRYKRYELYNNTSHEEQLKQEVQQVELEIQQVDSDQLKRTKKRRMGIIKKRIKKFEIAKENYLICETHLETIEDALRFIYEQSMTMSNPEEIGLQLDNLLDEMEETSSVINEFEQGSFTSQANIDEAALDAELEKAEKEHARKTSKRVKN